MATHKTDDTVLIFEKYALKVFVKRRYSRLFITANFDGDAGFKAIDSLYSKLTGILEKYSAIAVHVRIFGRREQYKMWYQMTDSCRRLNRCVTHIEGKSDATDNDFCSSGVEIEAVIPNENLTMPADIFGASGEIIGCRFKEHGNNFLILQNLTAGNLSVGNEEQTAEMLNFADGILKREGMNFRNVLRTWFYLDDILSWYGKFNDVRTEFFDRTGMTAGKQDSAISFFPASTGIYGRNAINGAGCTLDLVAVLPDKKSKIGILGLTNLRQKDAFRYGASFSRAVATTFGEYSELQLSGTASIDETGKSKFIGDAESQIRNTLEIVGELLESAGFGFEDICSGTAFLKYGKDLQTLKNVMKKMNLTSLPIVICNADVCRNDLLFEIDGIAVK